MIGLVAMPSSIAVRVARGRQRMVRRSSSVARRLVRIGFTARIGGSHCTGRASAPTSDVLAAKGTLQMKLGVHVGYWGLGMGPQEQLEVVKEAERLGYDSVWAAEAYGSDAATVLAWLAANTSEIRLGSAIFQMPGRSAAMTAMTVATIDELSGGRMILGIGSSGPQVAEGWHGQRFARQLQRTREYVAVVRMALSRARVEYRGETIELPLPDGPGKALKLMIAPVQERIPVYLAAIGPRNTALAGEIADGWLPTFFSPEHVGEVRGLLQEGADRAGRSLEGFDIAPTINACVSDDLEAARDLMRPMLALYVG